MKKKNIQMSSSEMITMFGSITNTTEPHYLPLSTALDRIREGKNKKTIDNYDIRKIKELGYSLEVQAQTL